MTANTAAAPGTKRKKTNTNIWPRLRLLSTLIFLALIGTSLLNGTTCQVSIGPVSFACPLGVVQVFTATRQILPWLLAAGLLGIGAIILFGRGFCGWLCPARLILREKAPGTPLPKRTRNWLQGIVFGGVIGASYLCHNPIFCTICPVGVTCRGAIAAGTGGSLLPTIGWAGAVVGLEQLTKRSWCQDFCPVGTLNRIFGRFNPFLVFKADPETCVPCKVCEQACPEGINLSDGIDKANCTKCFDCQVVCPRHAVKLQLIDIE